MNIVTVILGQRTETDRLFGSSFLFRHLFDSDGKLASQQQLTATEP
jgi:hypothetical protein